MAAGARGRGVPFAHHFGAPRQAPGGGGVQVHNTNLATAFTGLKNLIQDYDNIQLTTLKDLQSRYSVQEIGERLYTALLKGDNSTFNQITGILEMELERIYKEQLISEEADENEDEEAKATPVNEAREYIRQLEDIKDKAGNQLMHMAVKNIKKLKDSSYLNRLLDLGFPMYQINYEKIPTIYHLCEWADDEMFV